MTHASLPHKLPGLMAKLVEGSLDETEINLLHDLLSGSAEVRRYYYCYLDLHEELGQRVEFVHSANPASATTNARAKVAAMPSWRVRTVSFAAAAAVFYGVFAAIAWNLRPDKLPSLATGSPDPVAIVRDTTDVQWSKNASSKPAKSSILSGELLKIESGTMEIQLNAGTKLVVEGPADWSVDGNNSVSLRAGKLTARVPQQAIGFTIETPTAMIVDLGTEFGVETEPSGATEVQVLKGKVEIQLDPKSGKSSSSRRTITLTAGEARRIESTAQSGDVVIRKIASSADRFTPQAGPSKSRRIVVQGAMASSEGGHGYFVKALIDGNGMKGDCHATYHDGDVNNPPYHMWRSGSRKVKNEFVLFDFGRLHRIESMKVWNYNDGRLQLLAIGVKQADIYVSTSGKWDPLKDPNEWKLVVDDFKFNAAPGTDDYDTPDVIPLGNVEARFVAIVIDDRFGPPSNDAPEQDCVGLSEVQFFGEAVRPPKRSVAK